MLSVEAEADSALVEIDSRRQTASTALAPDVLPGDWVIIAAGTIIERLEADEADEIRRLLDLAAEGAEQQ